MLVLFYMYDYALHNDFMFKLLTCIHEDQTTSEPAEEVSKIFGVEIDTAEIGVPLPDDKELLEKYFLYKPRLSGNW